MAELHELDAHDLAARLRAREVSALEVVDHLAARIEQHDTDLRAFMTRTFEAARAAAAEVDAAGTGGGGAGFVGVPTAIKDLTSTAGVRTTLGSALMADSVPDVDAHVVSLVREAGLVSLGKTNTPELGLSSFTDNDLLGATSTPWQIGLNAGGSSGGAAAAVAAGFVPWALGSDGGGSIRIPASCCGLVGVKPTRGRVSPGPLGSDWSGLASDGPLARSVRDAAALLDVLAVPQVGDSRFVGDGAGFAEAAGRDPGRLRIAAWVDPYLPDIETDPRVRAVWEAGVRRLEALGHDVEVVANPFPPELEPQFNVVWSSGMAAAPIPDEALPVLRPTTRYWRERGSRHSAAELAAAMQYLEGTTRQVLTGLAAYDVFLTPTLARLPQPHRWFTEVDPVESHHRELLFTPFTALYNMAGIPAVSVPFGQADGLPVGLMLGSHQGRDRTLLSLASQLEAAEAWSNRPIDPRR
ncbi:amidase [Aeromicrobium sp. Leaf350]|uniref:amidase n=1 Tax=Aeromicrobium sp. Leaf350 TaxID=2876565 RepID=UPI001E390070|nr:amidase [Aeromicrobium sp. Leaf350]